MTTIRQFDIESWQVARELTRAIYAYSRAGSFAKDFGLRDQIRRASVSIMSNIAEGFERGGSTEFVQFLVIAKGSIGEVEAQLHNLMELMAHHARPRRLADTVLPTSSITGELTQKCIPVVQGT